MWSNWNCEHIFILAYTGRFINSMYKPIIINNQLNEHIYMHHLQLFWHIMLTELIQLIFNVYHVTNYLIILIHQICLYIVTLYIYRVYVIIPVGNCVDPHLCIIFIYYSFSVDIDWLILNQLFQFSSSINSNATTY